MFLQSKAQRVPQIPEHLQALLVSLIGCISNPYLILPGTQRSCVVVNLFRLFKSSPIKYLVAPVFV